MTIFLSVLSVAFHNCQGGGRAQLLGFIFYQITPQKSLEEDSVAQLELCNRRKYLAGFDTGEGKICFVKEKSSKSRTLFFRKGASCT